MINFNRKDDTIDAKIMRMREFYSMDDLWSLKEVCVNRDYNFTHAMTYLDMQTRTDYWVSYGYREPRIEYYILTYLRGRI